jgi:hypothetical protein
MGVLLSMELAFNDTIPQTGTPLSVHQLFAAKPRCATRDGELKKFAAAR